MKYYVDLLGFISSQNGVSLKQICKRFKINVSNVYGAINYLRKVSGENIKLVSGKYYHVSGSKSKSIKKPLKNKIDVGVPADQGYMETAFFLNREVFIKVLKNLDDGEREDYLTSLRNSIYYALSSDAILKAKLYVNDLREAVSKF